MEPIFERLSRHQPDIVGLERCNRFAVTFLFVPGENGWDILFEERAGSIDRQPGDVCLPGGMVESGEAPAEGALREVCEELLVRPDQVEAIGPLDVLVEDGNMVLYTFAAFLRDYHGTFNADEVSRVFTVPLEFFLRAEPELYYTTELTFPDENFPFDRVRRGRDYPWRKKREEMFFYDYNGQTIWGITAKLLVSFVRACLEKEKPEKE